MNTRGLGQSRGAPIILVVLVLIGWVTLRGLNWEDTYGSAELEMRSNEIASSTAPLPVISMPPDPKTGWSSAPIQFRPMPPMAIAKRTDRSRLGSRFKTGQDVDSSTSSDIVWTYGPSGHQMLFLAALRSLPVPRAVVEASVAAPPTGYGSPPPLSAEAIRDHWTIDGWALWRQGSGAAQRSQPRVATYGGSQMGGVVRYHFGSPSGRHLQAYARGYAALDGSSELELAMGVSARPLPPLPIRAHAEWRIVKRAQGSELRPAAFVTTEIPPFPVVGLAEAEVYAQGGFVGGEYDTLFADVQVAGTRQIAEFDLGDIDAGLGGWIGAQRGAHRVDIGPTLRMKVKIGDRPARMSIDWRERVAGDAEPKSGVAATISASF